MKNKVITFIENKNKTENTFNGDEKIFSIPYMKILEAEEYCTLEHLPYCYVGFSNYSWIIRVDHREFLYYIKVTASGIDPTMKEKYIYTL